MNLRSIDLNLLTVFDAVMAEGNMSRAADKIGMSQPAMSLAISRFRQLANDELFERSGHGVRPTARALELAGPVRRALDLVLGALEQTHEFDSTTSTRDFNLVLGDYGELLLLPRLIHEMEKIQASFAINTLAMTGLDIRKEMHFGNVDLFLWAEPFEANDDEFVSQQIGTDLNVCLVREDHPCIGSELTLEEYASLKHIILRLPASYGASSIERQLWSHNLQRSTFMRAHSLFEYPQAISHTDMIGTLPEKAAHSFAEHHKLSVVPSPLPFETPVYLMWPKSLHNDPGHRWLRELLINIYQQL